MKLFFDYLYSKRKVIALMLIMTAIFLISFALYHIPVSAVIYPASLCALCCVGFLLGGFFRANNKHKALERIKKQQCFNIGLPPDANDWLERDYCDIMTEMQQKANQIQLDDLKKYREMVEYYTLWAHQIKTPIASIKLTLQKEDSPAARRMFSELLHIEQYVEMVLAFLRLDSESSDFVFRQYSLDRIIRPSVRKFAAEFIDRRLRLEYDTIDKTIVTDEKWLAFVLEQILSNALKYTREGSISIYMSDDKTLCISDTGIGISASDLPRVFEKGYTGFNGRADKTASGIGLYLCRRVCEKLGIGISAASKVGEGTTIMLDLEQHEINPE